MAIDRVKKAAFIVPRKETHRLLSRLHALSALHVEDAAKVLAPPDDADLVKETLSAEKADLTIKRLNVIKSTFELFVKPKKGIVEGFAPLPLQVTRQELAEVISGFDFEPLYQECSYIYDEYRSLQSQIEQSRVEKESLKGFAVFPFSIRQALSLQNVTVVYGILRGKNWEAFSADREVRELLAWQEVRGDAKEMRVAVVFLNDDAEAARELLRKYGLAEVALPRLPGEVSDRIKELDEDVEERKEQQQAFRAKVITLAKESRRVEIALGHWESERAKVDAHNSVLHSHRMSIVTGWVRVKDLPKVQKLLDGSFPEATVDFADPVPGVDNPPVSLSTGWLSLPAQTLVSMFGLPDYYSFDPTPYLIVSFLLFFSYCFGDVIYGAMLVALSLWLAVKYRTQGPQHRFFMLFLYAGVGTMVFGAITGAWAGDLWDPVHLGKDNILQRLHDAVLIKKYDLQGNPMLDERGLVVGLLDPLKEPITMLLAALGIGILNQFYGITLHMYKCFRRRQPWDAIFDGLLWLIFLPGLILLIVPVFMGSAPQAIKTVGMVMAGFGAVSLVLTQGRNEKGFAAKLITGLVSLYGVLGTYGATSFMGDVLSYSRLLALGLTTSIVAMTFNIIAGMLKGVPVAGILLFLIVLAIGHSYNFLVSILTAFVHSARLIFLEFFGRFFEGGARRFSRWGLAMTARS